MDVDKLVLSIKAHSLNGLYRDFSFYVISHVTMK